MNHDIGLYPMRGIGAWLGVAVDTTTTSSVAWRACTRIADGSEDGWVTGLWTPSATPGAPTPTQPATELAVAVAEQQTVIDLPDIATSPPRHGTQLVGVPVWFWVQNHTPTSTTAHIPGLSATLTATPTTSHYRFSTGDTLTCPGPGTPYDPHQPLSGQTSDCTWEFTDNQTVTIDASLDWDLTWTATNGQTGTLPTVTRTTTFTLHIQQAQATTN